MQKRSHRENGTPASARMAMSAPSVGLKLPITPGPKAAQHARHEAKAEEHAGHLLESPAVVDDAEDENRKPGAGGNEHGAVAAAQRLIRNIGLGGSSPGPPGVSHGAPRPDADRQD